MLTDSKLAAALREVRKEVGESCPEECCAAACWNCYLCPKCATKWKAISRLVEVAREEGWAEAWPKVSETVAAARRAGRDAALEEMARIVDNMVTREAHED